MTKHDESKLTVRTVIEMTNGSGCSSRANILSASVKADCVINSGAYHRKRQTSPKDSNGVNVRCLQGRDLR